MDKQDKNVVAGEIYHAKRRGFTHGVSLSGFDNSLADHKTREDLRRAYLEAYNDGREAFRSYMESVAKETGYEPSVLRTQ